MYACMCMYAHVHTYVRTMDESDHTLTPVVRAQAIEDQLQVKSDDGEVRHSYIPCSMHA